MKYVKSGSQELRLCRLLRDIAVSGFEANRWLDLGIELGFPDIVSGHNRLLRSLSFGDDDYSTNAYEVIVSLAESIALGDSKPDVQRNLALMVAYFRDQGFEVDPTIAGERVSNSTVVGEPGSYSVTREIRMGTRSVTLKFRTETEAAFYDVLVKERYVVLPSCSMVYFNSEYGGTRVREPDFLVFFRGYCWQIEIDGSSHDDLPAYREQEKYDSLHDEGVVLRRISAVNVSNAKSESAAERRRNWAKQELVKLEAWMINQIKVRSRQA